MKKIVYYTLFCCTLCLGLAASCNNTAKEPEVTKMESTQDSLKQLEIEVSTQIEDLQKSMMEVDKEFEPKS